MRIIIQLSNTYDVIHAIWFANHHKQHVDDHLTTILGAKICKYYMFQLVNACGVYNKSKSEAVLLNFAPTTLSLHLVSCLLGHHKINQSYPYCKHFFGAITTAEEVNVHQIVCMLLRVEKWSSTLKLLQL